MNFGAIFSLASDVMNDLPDLEKSVSIITTIVTALEAKQMPAISDADLAQVKADVADLEKIIADIKAIV